MFQRLVSLAITLALLLLSISTPTWAGGKNKDNLSEGDLAELNALIAAFRQRQQPPPPPPPPPPPKEKPQPAPVEVEVQVQVEGPVE